MFGEKRKEDVGIIWGRHMYNFEERGVVHCFEEITLIVVLLPPIPLSIIGEQKLNEPGPFSFHARTDACNKSPSVGVVVGVIVVVQSHRTRLNALKSFAETLGAVRGSDR